MIFLHLLFEPFRSKRLEVPGNTLSCTREVDLWHQYPTCKVGKFYDLKFSINIIYNEKNKAMVTNDM